MVLILVLIDLCYFNMLKKGKPEIYIAEPSWLILTTYWLTAMMTTNMNQSRIEGLSISAKFCGNTSERGRNQVRYIWEVLWCSQWYADLCNLSWIIFILLALFYSEELI
jgi:hypothetical protein